MVVKPNLPNTLSCPGLITVKAPSGKVMVDDSPGKYPLMWSK